jgi:3-methyl-2-oxobutanoate hydroxymethyltransferase
MAAEGQKIAMLTAYDATLAGPPTAPASMCCSWAIARHGRQGRASTLPVSLDDVLYHTRCVAAGPGRGHW